MNALPKNATITLSLVAINLVFFAAQFLTQDVITNWGLLYGPLVSQGEYWRIVTSAFLHGSFIHIAFNMCLLYVFGVQLEQRVGSLHFFSIYVGALLASAFAVLFFASTQPTLGASGAVLGIVAAMFVALRLRGANPPNSPLLGLLVVNLALPLVIPGISFWGHLGGIVGGAIILMLVLLLFNRSLQK